MKPEPAQRILVVDDELAARMMMQATLEEAGFIVETADCCTRARELFRQFEFDLILLDVVLPDGDGYELCREMRAQNVDLSIPVAIVTGLDDLESIRYAYESGATDFITKPVAWGTLPYRVKYLLRSAQAMAKLSVSEGKNRALLANLPDIILCVRIDGRVSEVQAGVGVQNWSGWYHLPEAENHTYLVPEIYALVEECLRQALAEKNIGYLEFQWSPDGTRLCDWEARLVPQNDLEVLMVVRDITQRKKYENQLRLWGNIFESSSEAILITDIHFRAISVNKAFENMTGVKEADIFGVDVLAIGIRFEGASRYREIVHQLHETGHWQGELLNKRTSGEMFPCWFSISRVLNTAGVIENYVAIFSDITEYKNSRERIDFLAHHDNLTGLPNRILLNDRLGMALAQANRLHEKLGLLFIDLDRFKNINDSLGHATGDQVLVEVAERLVSAVRTVDTVARLGGDEFIVMFPSVRDESSLADLTIKIRDLLQIPFSINNMSLRITPSIGIAVYPEDGKTGDELIKNADAAMYLAKEKGRNNYQFYTPSLNSRTLYRLTLENDLRNAIDKGEFELHYQPQIVAATGEVDGLEALVRWRHAERGLISPAEFIPLAEETGLIIGLGDWVLAEAVSQIKLWQSRGISLLVSVNISALQFRQTDFLWKLNKLLAEAALTSSVLELELTETILMDDTKNSIFMLNRLRENGYRIAIDDFGTGFSSLNYLRHFPVDILKIDQSFIRDLMIEKESTAIVESIITLAHALGKVTIAEGVETEEQFFWLQSRNCRMMQGYLIAKPMPAEQLEIWMSDWTKQTHRLFLPLANKGMK